MKATRAFLVCVVVGRVVYQDSAEELALLVKSDGLEPVGLLDAKRDKPDPAFFIGSGKVDELGELAHELHADVVVFDVPSRRPSSETSSAPSSFPFLTAPS